MKRQLAVKKYNRYVAQALTAGADEAKIVPAANVKTAEWVRLKCQFGCDGFGNGLCCPPGNSGDTGIRGTQ